MDDWRTFAVVAGTAAAGLTGLLFVALAIRIEVIARSQKLRNRAVQTLELFVIALFAALFLSIPDQSLHVLGAEIVGLALITGAGALLLDRRARAGADPPDAAVHGTASLLEAVAPNAVTSILLVIAGMLLVFGVEGGLDVLVVPVVFALAAGIASAWLLLARIP